MNREIKFRAWHKKYKRMSEVTSLFPRKKSLQCTFDRYTFDEVELMEFTGTTDKNDVEIYEGDILLAPAYFGSLKCVCIYQQENTVSSIQGFGLYSYDSYFQTYRTLVESDEWDDFEVIGNIYENPDLIGDK